MFLVITKLDRLARSVSDLSSVLQKLWKTKNVDFEILDQSVNTATPAGRLLYHVLGAIGEFERDLINERVNEGLAKSKKTRSKARTQKEVI